MNGSTFADRAVEELRSALDRYAQDLDPIQVTKHVEALSTRYRAGGAASSPILNTPAHVAAYAIYRMPATFAAVEAALRQSTRSRSDFAPVTLLDLGGGTGAAAWAAASVFPSLTRVIVVDHSESALDLGRRLTAGTSIPALRDIAWRHGELGGDVPEADLVIVSYVLSELTPATQREVVAAATRAGSVVVVVEPGTPDGYRRVLAAREGLLARGGSVIAPCPHDHACPLERNDWCHFAIRITRSSLHRRAKNARLGHEDEKFTYVAAHMGGQDGNRATSRVLRNPAKRKGLVQLNLCQPDGTAHTEVVSKRQGPAYRAARSVEWGDRWPPESK